MLQGTYIHQTLLRLKLTMSKKDLNINEGSINFWINENTLSFNDGVSTRILNFDPKGGSILCIKDADNKLKFFFVVLGEGRVDIEFNVENVDETKKHMVTFTWSLEEKELNLYFDGKKEVTEKIPF